MTDSRDIAVLDEDQADEEVLERTIQERERLMLRWPLLLGTAAVLYGSLCVIYIVIRILSFLFIYMSLWTNVPPSGLLLMAQLFPIVSGFFLGCLLFVAGIITLRRRIAGPKLINLWSFFTLGSIILSLMLRLQTMPDFVEQQMIVYDRVLDREALIASQSDEVEVEDVIGQMSPATRAAQEVQLSSDTTRLFVAFAVMGACGPGLFWFILNIPRIRRTWVCWD